MILTLHSYPYRMGADVAIMTGAVRRTWTHEIAGSDIVARRLSVTFRTVG